MDAHGPVAARVSLEINFGGGRGCSHPDRLPHLTLAHEAFSSTQRRGWADKREDLSAMGSIDSSSPGEGDEVNGNPYGQRDLVVSEGSMTSQVLGRVLPYLGQLGSKAVVSGSGCGRRSAKRSPCHVRALSRP